MPATTTLRLVKIENNLSTKLPKRLCRKFGWTTEILTEERPEGLLLRRSVRGKLSWDESFKAMAKCREDWSEWNTTTADGL